MDIKTINRKYDSGEYSFHSTEDTHKLPDNHVFDGEKSVNWNKEELARENKRRADIRIVIHRKNDELMEKLHSDVVNYIAETFNMTVQQAMIIENYVWDEKHYCMSEYFSAIDDIADVMRRVIETK